MTWEKPSFSWIEKKIATVQLLKCLVTTINKCLPSSPPTKIGASNGKKKTGKVDFCWQFKNGRAALENTQ